MSSAKANITTYQIKSFLYVRYNITNLLNYNNTDLIIVATSLR